ncbi:hypothetical protein [Clostridium weizhouense]|uniref:Uncharacterized protein n=1 Tax=Clostridium weizhouense TaxID=2859781 RepID=A0ABS7AQ33_9CLOT|nr:hypothetical protein [Clostridium weizhouense]MBW6410777.1 hypothetical protein [Clostridium weizhouense]
MMPFKESYTAEDLNMSGVVKILNDLIINYKFSTSSIEKLAHLSPDKIKNFLEIKDGITYDESIRTFLVAESLKNICAKFSNKFWNEF